ncbi:sce7725 family protein [Levilactobacillus tujiorum]|uniref:Sce7725 family protein n=1 Tax=Levilactobacillus tujiorum TaxID=2912243 RepID=A0ABX1L4H6_9LACO|nr:sce7725 family protein [Levilactobacillus tujiorum]MCH5464074.1 sce7725 family protein [Levilactobacillus tujiorum]NLR11174.1 sce7725 family protein [Lactobacillus sp. HBUAS51387]NLR29199.1 sce7725 family protein [Levilactobacillus tujiorum]
MYLPWLRGKQNELLALQELLKEGNLSKNILPIIEPLKTSTTFKRTLSMFNENEREIAVIQNTSLVDYPGFRTDDVDQLKAADSFVWAYQLTAEARQVYLQQDHKKMGILAANSDLDDASELDRSGDFLVLDRNDRHVMRKAHELNKISKVELNDEFHKRSRNVDYIEVPDELFSEEHLYYQDDGFKGFSDYSIIGGEYNESGFAPRAVAIHLVYFDSNERLRVHHFVSDTNDDIHDPGNKFSEALHKMMSWVDSKNFDSKKNKSSALDDFRKINLAGRYPGLGVVKKLTLKHHLEIMGRYLDGVL